MYMYMYMYMYIHMLALVYIVDFRLSGEGGGQRGGACLFPPRETL